MHTKLAGHLPLQDMIAQVIQGANTKLASVAAPAARPAPVQETEKVASAIDHSDAGEVEKLASALDLVGDGLLKKADSIENGDESRQGGQQLPTQSPTGGKQSLVTGKARFGQLPKTIGSQKGDDNGASTQMPNDYQGRGNGAGIKNKNPAIAGIKQAGAVGFVLNKMAETLGGGEVLTDDQSGNNPKAPKDNSNSVRSVLQNNEGPVSFQKVDGKVSQKKALKAVLTEPAQSKATDKVVHENLRNASKGGVKIAAARALLAKVASEGCKCNGTGGCRACKLSTAMDQLGSK